MPFTIDGQWIPKEPEPEPKKTSNISGKPVKVRLVKRGNNKVTVILNLPIEDAKQAEFLTTLKRKLGCGGTLKEEGIEIQGDKVEPVIKYLKEQGFKPV